MQGFVGKLKPKLEAPKPKIRWKRILFDFTHHHFFETFILSLIIINTIIFMMHDYR